MITIRFGNNIFTIFGLFSYLSCILSSFVFAGYIEKYLCFIPGFFIPLCANMFAENNLQHYIRFNFREIRPRFYSFGAVYGYVIYAFCLYFYGIPFCVSVNIICKALCLTCGLGRIGCHYYGCCWGKEMSIQTNSSKTWINIYPIRYNNKDTLILRLYPHFIDKYFFPIQIIESTILLLSGVVLYIIDITYGFDSAIPNLIIYYIVRYKLNTYRHNYVKGTNIIDFIIVPLVFSLYLYMVPLPSNVMYVGFIKQFENFIKNHSFYYGFIPAFIYGFHYKKLGYWYNP